MRRIPIVVAAVLLAGCDGANPVAAPTAPSYTDYQCPSGEQCWSDPDGPELLWASRTDSYWYHEGLLTAHAHTVHQGWSWSENRSSYIYSSQVDAKAYLYLDCNSNNRSLYKTATKTVYGVARAEVSFSFKAPDRTWYAFQVVGTHRFVPKPGYSGGGTFTSEASHCDNGI